MVGDMLGLPSWAHDLSLASLTTIVSGVGTYWLMLRQARRDDSKGLSDRTTLLFNQLQTELERSTRTVGQYQADLELLRDARFALEDKLVELRDHAVAARAMVHEYERRLELPLTAFPPLPRLGMPARAPPAAA